MQNPYYLLHKNNIVCQLDLSSDFSSVLGCHLIEPELAPFLGNFTTENARKWWRNRAIPSDRQFLKAILERSGAKNTSEYMAKNLALSISDTYWIRPVSSDLTWEDVNLFQNHENKVRYHNASSFDPSASLNGSMTKYWAYEGDAWYLYKTTDALHYQQNINEIFANCVCFSQHKKPALDFVPYDLIHKNGIAVGTKCKSFTNENTELVYAYDILFSEKDCQSESNFEKFIRICCEHGLPEDEIRGCLDYMTLFDFAIANEDRHLNNFGILRDTDTMKFIKMAPLYDHGNSMFWRSPGIRLTRSEELAQPITSISSNFERSLRHVKNRHALNVSLLPSPEEVVKFYQREGMAQGAAETLGTNFAVKRSLLEDLAEGKSLSAYKEKQAENQRPDQK